MRDRAEAYTLLEAVDAFVRARLSEKRYGHTLRVAKEWDLPVGEPERQSPKLLHGPVAAELSRRELGVEDADILEAIRVHTVGRPQMGPLALVLYVADKIEPARD